MKNLLLRSFTGLLYVGIIVYLIIFGSSWGFPILCSVFAILATIEFFKMTDTTGGIDIPRIIDIIGAILISALPICHTIFGLNTCIIITIAYYLFRTILQLYTHEHSPAGRLSGSLMSTLYIAAPLAITSMLYLNNGAAITLAMFVMIWLNDTGAFCVGSLIGRNRLFPRHSPKKSWEGFFGGMAFCIGAAFIIKQFFGTLSTDLSLTQLCIMGAVVCISSTWGDLIESMFKRAANIKDSGHLLPGHGGILDRIDSLLLVAPSVWLLLLIFNIF